LSLFLRFGEDTLKPYSNVFLFLSGLLVASAAGYAQNPQQQEPPAPPPTPGISRVTQPPPLPPKPPEVLQQDEGTISVEPDLWIPVGHPTFDKGKGTDNTTDSRVVFPGNNKASLGGVVRVPAGHHNAIRVTYLNVRGSGTYTAPDTLLLWSGGFNPGDSIVSDYHLQSVNISFDYLTWPFPPRERRFRLKTLWQVQYVNASSSFVAPLSTASSPAGSGSHWLILPALGLGATEYLSKNFRVEANVSGFDIPHHTAVANATANLAYKFGLVELRGGANFLYFKTSPQADFYTKGRLDGAFVGIRLAWRP
jgi:hypothetical protein